jgi:DNA-binding XRE family transcriptional regulator
VWVDVFRPRDIPAPEDYEDIDDVIARHETNAVRGQHLQEARIALATREQNRITGLAALRLRKGWSQKRLADEVGTSQPHIARLELGHEDILMSTARRLATALDVPIQEINSALLARGSPK